MKIIANDYEPRDIIKIIREWSDLSQTEFGESINRTKHSIQSMELGRNNVYLHTLIEIAKIHDLVITVEKRRCANTANG